MNAKDTLRSYVAGILEKKGGAADFGDEEPLLASGRLESLDVVEILGFMEATFGLDLGDRGFHPSDFDTLDAMSALAETSAARR
jgi:acyl carrier protein